MYGGPSAIQERRPQSEGCCTNIAIENSRQPGVMLCLEELASSVSDIESAYNALNARLAPAIINRPCSNVSPKDECGQPRRAMCSIGDCITRERERITALAKSIRLATEDLDI